MIEKLPEIKRQMQDNGWSIEETNHINNIENTNVRNPFPDEFVDLDEASIKKEADEQKEAAKNKKKADRLAAKQDVLEKTIHDNMPEYMPRNLIRRNRLLKRPDMSKDVAKLGSKTYLKPNEAEREMNRRIDEAKGISDHPTAYTAEIKRAVTEAERNFADIDANNSAKQAELMHRTKIFSVNFSPKMLESSYIRQHISECVSIVLTYDRVIANPASGKEFIEGEHKNLGRLMSLFSKRVEEFCKKNGIDMNNIEDRKAKLKENEKFTEDDLRKFTVLSEERKSERKKKRKEGFREDHKAENACVFSRDEYDDLKTKVSDSQDAPMSQDEIIALYAKSKQERIHALPEMRGDIKKYENQIRELEKGDVEFFGNEEITKIRKCIADIRVLLHYTEEELKYDNSYDAKDFDRLYDAYEDYRKMMKRFNLPQDAMEERNKIFGTKEVTREEAFSTASDIKSFEKRMALLTMSEKILNQIDKLEEKLSKEKSAKVKQVIRSVREYYNASIYNGSTSNEVEKLKKLIKALDGAGEELTGKLRGIRDLKKAVSDLTTGGLDATGKEIVDKSNVRPKTVEYKEPEKFSGFSKMGIFEKTIRFFSKWEDNTETPLFAHEPTVNDLRQGKVCNCWMVAGTTAVINQNPDIIKNCMRDNGDGTVTVRLFTQEESDGKIIAKPNYIRVKKEVPKTWTGGSIAASGALWMQMLERAAAHMGYMNGMVQNENYGYSTLWYGAQSDWIFALTGCEGEKIVSHELAIKEVRKGKLEGFSKFKDYAEDDDGIATDSNLPVASNEQFKTELFNNILNAKKDGYVYTFGSNRKDVQDGFNASHAYTVIGAKEVNGERRIILRNPYANMSLKYDKKGKSYRTDSMLSSARNETNGMFSVSLDDFLRNAGEISRVKISNNG